LKPEKKLWHELKKNTPKISWTRIENLSVFGTPDLLGYNANGHFFTLELKVTKGNKIRFSPHQIAFHVKHPNNTFILVKSLDTSLWKLYEGKVIRELAACGLKLDACCSGLEACRLTLESLGA
jgi:Holliday junction resolvase